MNKLVMTAMMLGGVITLSGCQTHGGPGVSNYYECDRGTRLKVSYLRNGALVSVNGRRTLPLKSVPGIGGGSYEGAGGVRLRQEGGRVIWNTADRSAPESCREVAVPR